MKVVCLQLPKTYQDCGTLKRLITGYIDTLKAFDGAQRAGTTIKSADISGRALELVIPAHSMTGAQKAAIDAAVTYGQSQGVRVILIEMF